MMSPSPEPGVSGAVDPASRPIPWRVLAALGLGLAVLYGWPNQLGSWAFAHERPLLPLEGQAWVSTILAGSLEAVLIDYGRGAAALAMLALAAGVFALARRLLDPGWASLTAAIAGVTPLATVAAHVSAATPFAVALALWATVLAASERGRGTTAAAVFVGIAAGLAVVLSGQGTLVVLGGLAVVMLADGRARAIAAALWLAGSLVALWLHGLPSDPAPSQAAATGLLRWGIGRGLTWMVTLPSLLVLGLMMGQARQLPRLTGRLLLAVVGMAVILILWPPQDGAQAFDRLLPVLPLVAILLTQGLYTLSLALAPVARLLVVTLLSLALIGVPLGYSIAALGMMADPRADPRVRVADALGGHWRPGDVAQAMRMPPLQPTSFFVADTATAKIIDQTWPAGPWAVDLLAEPGQPIACALQPIGPLCPRLWLIQPPESSP